MRIVQLNVSNFKRITAIELNPDPNVVEIAGKNAQGKTSIMDAIAVLLGGKKMMPEQPVHDDAERSVIQADVGDYIIRRTITPDGKGTISVKTKDGMTAASPQDVLNNLIGNLTFDPLLFVRQKPEEQMATLQAFAPDDVDFDTFDADEKEAYDERTSINREVKRLQAVVASLPALDDLPAETDVSELLDGLEKARERNAGIRAKKAKRDAAAMQVKALDTIIADSTEEIEALRQRIAGEEERIAKAKAERDPIADALAKVKPLPDYEDESALTEQLRTAQAANDKRAAAAGMAAQATADRKRLEEVQNKSASLTSEIERIQKAREDALKAIDLPVKGLSMGPAGITFNGHPLSQASFAQQLQLGIALAMKANPKLKVAIVKEASMLDDDAMDMLKNLAVKEDFQVWIERVGTGGEDAIVIEAGEVKGAAKRKAK